MQGNMLFDLGRVYARSERLKREREALAREVRDLQIQKNAAVHVANRKDRLCRQLFAAFESQFRSDDPMGPPALAGV